jgi:Flp pilus assembly protein TadG
MTPRATTRISFDRNCHGSAEELGSFTVFAAVLALALFALLGLVIDGGRAVAAQSNAAGEAEQAARIGAGQISVEAIRSGTLEIDPASATAAAQRYLRTAGSSGVITVAGQTVTVEIRSAEPTVVLGIIGVRQIGISASASATNVHGVTRADS